MKSGYGAYLLDLLEQPVRLSRRGRRRPSARPARRTPTVGAQPSVVRARVASPVRSVGSAGRTRSGSVVTSGSQSSMPARRNAAATKSRTCARRRWRHVVARLVGSGGAHHRVDVVGRPAPVAPGVEVAEREPVRPALGDGGHGGGDLAGHEPRRAARRLVVVEDRADGVQAAAAVDVDHQVRVGLRGAVRVHRPDRRGLVLRAGAPARRRSRRWTPARSGPARPCCSCTWQRRLHQRDRGERR